uniref:C2 domain-containing protein n=1 Tax=Ditylenchus dipsaci TaxID=166011 RepID=A0A915EE53_9BILA
MPFAPQVLHLKILSAQQLARPRGSTAKGDSADPFVVVEIFGIPPDCAEERTKTIRNDIDPNFDESFQFEVCVSELALIRFLVLDDDYIGDDFIGQYTIPFECLTSGYRHVPLLNNEGDPLESTLFVHIAITNRRGGGKAKKRGMSVKRKTTRVQTGMKMVGIKSVDELFRKRSQLMVLRKNIQKGILRRVYPDEVYSGAVEMFAFFSKKVVIFAPVVFLVVLFMLSGSACAAVEAEFQENISVPLRKVSVKVDEQVPKSGEKTQAAKRLVLHLLSSNHGDYNGPPFEVDLDHLLAETKRQGCEIRDGKNEWDMIHQGGYEFLIDCHEKPTSTQIVRKSYFGIYLAIFVGSFMIVVVVILFLNHKMVAAHVKSSSDNNFGVQIEQAELDANVCPVVEDPVSPKRKKKKHKKVVKKPEPTVVTLPAAILQQLNPPKQKADWQLKLDAGKQLSAEEQLNKELDEAENRWQPTAYEKKRKRRFAEQAMLKSGEKRQLTTAELAVKKLKNEAIDRYTKRVYLESLLNEQHGASQMVIKQESKRINICHTQHKIATSPLVEFIEMKSQLEAALIAWQEECGLGPTGTMRQGLRLIHSRIATAASNSSPPNSPMQLNNGTNESVPGFQISQTETNPSVKTQGAIPETMLKTFTSLQEVLRNCEKVTQAIDGLLAKLTEATAKISECNTDLPQLCLDAGLRSQKSTRACENFAWNVRLLKAQLTLMHKTQTEANDIIFQVVDTAKVLGVYDSTKT